MLLKTMPWGADGQECLTPACQPGQWGLGSLGAGDSLPLSCEHRGGLAACLLLTRNINSPHSYLLTGYLRIANPKPPSGGPGYPFGSADAFDLQKLSRVKVWKEGRTLGSSSPLSTCLGVVWQTMSPSAIPMRGYLPGHIWGSSLVSAERDSDPKPRSTLLPRHPSGPSRGLFLPQRLPGWLNDCPGHLSVQSQPAGSSLAGIRGGAILPKHRAQPPAQV